MRTLRAIFLLAFLCALTWYSTIHLYQMHSDNKDRKLSQLVLLPETIAKATVLEFHGIASDYLMLKTLTYAGEKTMENKKLTPDEWQMVYQTLVQITNLDPRFFDPYLMAAMVLPWDAGMIDETNILLEKAGKILTDDYRPYFFLWHNYYKFLNDPQKAAYYMQKAAAKPSAPPYFATLAARMHLYAGDTYASVIFLQVVIKETNDPLQLKFLKTRLQALQKIGFLEHKIQIYRKQFQHIPKTLQELIEKKIIDEIPTDPYGGKFYLLENGRVYTTSKLVFTKQ